MGDSSYLNIEINLKYLNYFDNYIIHKKKQIRQILIIDKIENYIYSKII